ncbi:MATE family efflux transporter [Verrucomicrobiaceae bacterium 5K15]|uniref:Multidrug-efflux transporter n=1 Tax=Oceaniferula flava TaxID=2800421 RepID=A0AAE2VAW7_9BACT|nr:MATE family efflux transporter [Oceaniferula flavus]MBK1853845.1 MATE family efflux transporter [Oceaniferula flavus]MBM1135151.1 MATE family efflux transporter [Oceaniferula flavus]
MSSEEFQAVESGDGLSVIDEPPAVAVPMELGGKLAGLSLPRQVLALALWPFLQNLMGVGVGFADMMIAGRMESGEASEAVMDMMGAGMYLMWLLMILQGAMATGAMALVSRATGARDIKSANLALGQSLLLGVVSGFLSGVLIWLVVPHMGRFFGLSDLAQEYVVDYMRIGALLAPFSGVMFVASSCLRAYGDTVKPFMAMLLVNVINVGVSLYFVYELGWGVQGLAGGTVIGWACGAAMILWFLRPGGGLSQRQSKKSANSLDPLVLRLENMRYDMPMLRRIWRISWPSMIEIIGMWSVHAVGVYFIGSMKAGTIGAHAMVVRLESVSFMPGFAIGMAASTLTGQYLGAKDPEMAKKAVRFCWVLAVVTMGGAGVLISVFNTEFLALFGDPSSAQFQMAAPVIRFVGLMQVLTASMMVMKMSMRGAGDTRTVTIYSFTSMGLIRVGVLWWVIRNYDIDLMGIWQVMICDVLLQSAIFVWLHFRGRWLTREV